MKKLGTPSRIQEKKNTAGVPEEILHKFKKKLLQKSQYLHLEESQKIQNQLLEDSFIALCSNPSIHTYCTDILFKLKWKLFRNMLV